MPLSDLTHHSIMPLTTTISCRACSACPPAACTAPIDVS